MMLDKIFRTWNPWWATGKVDTSLTGTSRDITDRILERMDTRHIKDIVGVRRSGKTTVMYQVISRLIDGGVAPKDILFLNFDDPGLMGVTFEELDDAIQSYNPDLRYLLLDEVQSKDGWESWIRTVYDAHRYEQILVSGSSSSVLSADLGRVLTGRHLTTKVYPFSFREYLKVKGWTDWRKEHLLAEEGRIHHHLMNYLQEGGFPEVIGANENRRKEIHSNLFNDIVLRDIISRHGLKLHTVMNVAFHLVSNSCNEYSFRRVAGAMDISVETVSSYLEHITESELIHTIGMHTGKLGHQFKQNKKVYCIDHGLVNSISFSGEDPAKALETMVFVELLHREKDITYWKGDSQKQIDLILEEKRPVPYQVCLDLRRKETKEREIGSLLASMDDLKVETGHVITMKEEGLEKFQGKEICIKPVWKFLLGLV
jgi:uncharacterized protein